MSCVRWAIHFTHHSHDSLEETYLSIHLSFYLSVYVCMYVCMYVCVRACVCVCVNKCPCELCDDVLASLGDMFFEDYQN